MERDKGKPNFIQRQIDKLIEKYRVQSSGKQISSLDEDRPSEYHVQQMFRPPEDTVKHLF